MIEGDIAYLDAFDPDETLLKDSLEQVDQPSTYLPEYRCNSFGGKETTVSTKVDPDETIDDLPINPEVTMIGMCPNCGGLTAADNKPIRCSRCAEWCCEDCAPYGTCLDCDKEKTKGQLINPDYHEIHPSPLDCADVLALRAFGVA